MLTINFPKLGPYHADNEIGVPIDKTWTLDAKEDLAKVECGKSFRVIVTVEVLSGVKPKYLLAEITDSTDPENGAQLNSDGDVDHDPISESTTRIVLSLTAPRKPGTYYVHIREFSSYRPLAMGRINVVEQ
ncbi:MAG: hypothetical protein R3C03_07220 [Pirellulaceae bacterium]